MCGGLRYKTLALLKDRELAITVKAEQLLKEVEDSEVYFLYSKIRRAREKGKLGRPIPPQAQL